MAAVRDRRTFGRLLAVVFAACLPALAEDSRICAGCHREIWETYRRTGMSRSFYRLSPATAIEDFTKNNTFYHQPSDSYFTMLSRDGKYYQGRYQLDSAGRRVNVMEKPVAYVIGSGNHARTYLYRTGAGSLFELPLGWYAEKGGYWAMNPGYDRPHHDGFRRPIAYDCMFCHNAYPDIPAGHDRPFAEPVYSGALPEGIDCQRCHGPGMRHAQLAGSGRAAREDVRKAIVNPARLSAARQMETCMVCHLETTSFPLPNAVQRYGRGPFSYRPGEPLADFLLNFDHAPGAGREDKFEIVSAAYRLRRSACFLKSNGKLLCTTCHNPHDMPRGAEAARRYTAVCQQCHAASHAPGTNCVGCHMPTRRTEDVVHAAATDHYIQRRKPAGDLLADRAEREGAYRGPVVLYYPETLPRTAENDLLLAVAQVKQGSNLAQGIPALTAAIAKYSPRGAEYDLELAEALEKDGRPAEAARRYRAAAQRDPTSAAALQKLGTALRRSGQYAEAAEALQRSASLDPARALTWHELGLAWRGLGRSADAVAAIGKALALDPELPEAQNNLGVMRLAAGEQARAELAFREAIRIRPDFADARVNLANVLAASGRGAEARDQFERALRLRPGDARAHYDYAVLLGRGGDADAAQRELEAALRADPEFADAHLLLGRLLLARGKPRDAIPHLEKAAASADRATREQAAELLRQAGK